MKKSVSKWSTILLASSASLACFVPVAYLVAAEDAKPHIEATKGDDDSASNAESEEDAKFKKITDAQWKKKLTKTQYAVTRKHDTERAYSGKYHDSKKDGVYVCICCELPLFDSKTKFDSGTGWPSFYEPIKAKNVGTSEDHKMEYVRTEVHCHRCDAHLGHVFEDAPQTPTGLRYCMNSASLNFIDRADVKKLTEKTATVAEETSAESK